MRRVRNSGTAVLTMAVLLSGCAYQPTIQHPKLAPLASQETALSCPEIDLAIDRADTVRWVIRDDGGQLETKAHRAARYTGDAMLLTLMVLSGTVPPPGLDDGGHAVLTAADIRVQQLLELKRDHGCPPRPTALPGMDDLGMLAALEQVQAQLDAGGDRDTLFVERTRLLDTLRVMPTPAVTP